MIIYGYSIERGANLTRANLSGVVYSHITCPIGTNSNSHGNTCAGQGGGL